jgi:hypothetical protein
MLLSPCGMARRPKQMGASKMERVGGGAPEAHNVHVASSDVQLTILVQIDHTNMQP